MTKQPIGMTRDQMQTEALAIECLLSAATALFSARDSHDDLYECVERAHNRARQLNEALDIVSRPQVAS